MRAEADTFLTAMEDQNWAANNRTWPEPAKDYWRFDAARMQHEHVIDGCVVEVMTRDWEIHGVR
jgi:hypothetical protein